jgi:voltage-gated potassium channel
MAGSAAGTVREHGNAYNIFILVLTILSLGIMVALVLPLDEATLEVLGFYDNLICIVFLGDVAYNLSGSHPRSEYFVRHRGWLDLLGSIPSLGILRYTALLRLFRLSRLFRIARLLRGKQKKALIADVIRNRGQYALFITLVLVMLVLSISSVLVLQFESRSPDANITTGGDALWWAIVTITTVGYGDHYPVTTLGRMTAVAVMFSGIGIIGALASILASLLVSPSGEPEAATEPSGSSASGAGAAPVDAGSASNAPGIGAELAQARAELAETRAEIAELRRHLALSTPAYGGATLDPPPGQGATSGA